MNSKMFLQALAVLKECFYRESKMEPSHIRLIQGMWHMYYNSHLKSIKATTKATDYCATRCIQELNMV